MSSKRKHQPESWIDYISHELLFLRHFEIQTSLSPEECAQQLVNMAAIKRGRFFPTSIYRIDLTPNFESYDFDIRARDGSRNQNTTIHAYGEILPDDAGCFIEGEVRFGKVYFILLLFSIAWIFFLLQMFGYFPPLFLFIFLFSPLYTFWQMYRMRNKLLEDMEMLLRPDISKSQLSNQKAHSRLMMDKSESLSFDSVDESKASNYGRQ